MVITKQYIINLLINWFMCISAYINVMKLYMYKFFPIRSIEVIQTNVVYSVYIRYCLIQLLLVFHLQQLAEYFDSQYKYIKIVKTVDNIQHISIFQYTTIIDSLTKFDNQQFQQKTMKIINSCDIIYPNSFISMKKIFQPFTSELFNDIYSICLFYNVPWDDDAVLKVVKFDKGKRVEITRRLFDIKYYNVHMVYGL